MTKRKLSKFLLVVIVGAVVFSFFFWGETVFREINETRIEILKYKSSDLIIEKVVSTNLKNSEGFYNKIYYSSEVERGIIAFGNSKIEKIEEVKFDEKGKSAKLTFQLQNDSVEVVDIILK